MNALQYLVEREKYMQKTYRASETAVAVCFDSATGQVGSVNAVSGNDRRPGTIAGVVYGF